MTNATEQKTIWTSREASYAAGVSTTTIAAWASRGRLLNFDAKFGVKGRSTQYSKRDVLALALIQTATSCSVESPELLGCATTTADDWLRHRGQITELVVRRYPKNHTSIRYNDSAMMAPAEPGALVTTTLGLNEIFGPTLEALEDPMPFDGRQRTIAARTQ